MGEETKKDEGIVETTGQESSASAVPDSKLDGVAGGKVDLQPFNITRKIDKNSAKLYE
ncbi:MAG: hypothetical protein WB755_00985 [Terriglobales bacterium]